MNKKIIQFLQSFVAIPMMVVAAPLVGAQPITNQIAVLSQNNQAVEVSVITTQEMEIRTEHAKEIDDFFDSREAPLSGYGMKFVIEAEKNDIDYRLLPAIAMRESTGGKQACKRVPNSVFGYGSCKMSFDSIDESIEIVAKSLGGNNPNTAKHYDNKTTKEILRKYNSVIRNYPQQVINIMKMINDKDEIV